LLVASIEAKGVSAPVILSQQTAGAVWSLATKWPKAPASIDELAAACKRTLDPSTSGS
jgi:hypothetical protein